jgi:hypothetical protein
MRFHIPSYLIASLFLFPKLPEAQIFNTFTNLGCSTMESIVSSCGDKIQTQITVSSIVFSCICYDNSGNYAPSIYGDAASSCADFLLSAYSTTANAFIQYAASFCTDPSFAPAKTTPQVTIPTATSAGASSSGSTPAQVSYDETLLASLRS